VAPWKDVDKTDFMAQALVMKKTYGVSKKTKGAFGYCKHLRKDGKRRANKDTRKIKDF
jgi:hypothetical protein